MDGIHFWGDEWNGKSVLEARSLFENGMIQAEIQRKRESDFQYSNREIANNEPPTLLREKRSGAGGFAPSPGDTVPKPVQPLYSTQYPQPRTGQAPQPLEE